MRTPLSASANLASTDQPNLPQWLVPPFDRWRFTLLFVIATGIGWLLVGLVLPPLQNPSLPASWVNDGLLGAFVSGLVTGLIVGATQWLGLRRYVPDWLWIIANTAGYVLLMTTLQGWRNLLEQGWHSNLVGGLALPTSPDIELVIAGILGTTLTALCTLWLGWLQWLVLRQYARPSWQWVFVPAIAVLVSSCLFFAGSALVSAGVPTYLDANILGAGVMGTTQAIALCTLSQYLEPTNSDRSLLLVHAPQLKGRKQITTISLQLQQKLSQAWTTSIGCPHPLTYLIGADATGAIVASAPTNQPATEHLHRTPLAAIALPATITQTAALPPVARFQVTFMPSGKVKIRVWKGIPLLGLATLMLLFTIAASVLGSYLMR